MLSLYNEQTCKSNKYPHGYDDYVKETLKYNKGLRQPVRLNNNRFVK